MTRCQKGAPVQVVEDLKLSKGLIENEFVGPHKAKLWFDLANIFPACFGLCEELLAQVPWVPILVSLSHFQYTYDRAHEQERRLLLTRSALMTSRIHILFAF